MEKRENIYQPPLLPKVSMETIEEIMFEEEWLKEEVVKHDNNPTLVQHLSLGRNEDRFTFIAGYKHGGMQVYQMLAREAQKTGKKLPRISMKDIQDYFLIHPYSAVAKDLFKNPQLDIEALQDLTEKMEYTPLTPDKYTLENPFLMEYIKSIYFSAIQEEETKGNRLQSLMLQGISTGGLFTYELLRTQAEKERMKGLGL